MALFEGTVHIIPSLAVLGGRPERRCGRENRRPQLPFSIGTSPVYTAGGARPGKVYPTSTTSHTSACRRADATAFGDGLQKAAEGRSYARSASLNGLPCKGEGGARSTCRAFSSWAKRALPPGFRSDCRRRGGCLCARQEITQRPTRSAAGAGTSSPRRYVNRHVLKEPHNRAGNILEAHAEAFVLPRIIIHRAERPLGSER